jgi:hypothetical protein
MKLLLAKEGVVATDKWGQMPLLWAIESGHDEVAKLLLGKVELWR